MMRTMPLPVMTVGGGNIFNIFSLVSFLKVFLMFIVTFSALEIYHKIVFVFYHFPISISISYIHTLSANAFLNVYCHFFCLRNIS